MKNLSLSFKAFFLGVFYSAVLLSCNNKSTQPEDTGWEKLSLVKIDSGSFNYDTTAPETIKVRITRPFYIDEAEVTIENYHIYEQNGGSDIITNYEIYLDTCYKDTLTKDSLIAKRGEHPMENVSWFGAALFCNWRSREEGFEPCYNESTFQCNFLKNGYRLPTEAELEYVLTKYGSSSSNPPMPVSTISYNIRDTLRVGRLITEGGDVFGLNGNVWEWYNDWYSPQIDFHSSEADTLSGGSVIFYNNPKGTDNGAYKLYKCGKGTQYRGGAFASSTKNFIGFRCVRKAD